jgi:hypothetical protein
VFLSAKAGRPTQSLTVGLVGKGRIYFPRTVESGSFAGKRKRIGKIGRWWECGEKWSLTHFLHKFYMVLLINKKGLRDDL